MSNYTLKDSSKINQELIAEIYVFKKRIQELENSEAERKRVEKALRDSEEQYRTLVENINELIYTLDIDGRFTYISPVLERLSGYKIGDLIGKSFAEFAHPDDLQGLVASINRTKQGEIEPYEFRILNGDQVNYVRTSSRLILNDGVAVGLTCVMTDITERKRTEEEKRRSQETVERVAEEMALIAEIGRVVGSTLDLNQVFERVTTETRKLIPFDRFLVNLKKTPDGQFVAAYVSGIDNPERREGNLYPSQGSATGVVMNTRTGILIQPVEAEEIRDLYPNLYETFKTGLRSTMSVPLISMGEVIGSMNFRSKKLKAYAEKDLRLAERIGMQVAGAIANAQLYDGLNEKEKSLRESEAKYRLIAENSADQISVLDMNLRFTYVSPAIMRLRGFAVEEAMAQTLEQVLTPESIRIGLTAFEQEMQLEASGTADPDRMRILELEEYKNDGSIIWVEVSLSFLRDKDNKPIAILTLSRDITERKRVEGMLREQENKLSSIFRAAPVGIGVVIKRVLWEANDMLCWMTGYSREELLGQNALMLYPTQEEYDYVGKEKYRQISENRIGTVETRWKRKDGTVIDIILSSTPLDSGDLAKGVTFTALDITDRKRAEEALREREERYRQLVEYAPAAIYEADLTTGRLLSVNEVLCEYSGYTRDELLALNPLDLMTEESQKLILQRMAGYAAGEPVHPNVEYKARNKTGREFWISTNAKYFYREGLPVRATVVAYDITERKRVEEDNRTLAERLQRAEKMEVLGQLAGGVAHDLNNVLGILSGYSELLLEEIPEGSRSRGHAEKILQSTEKGAAIIQDLLTLARRGVIVSDVVNLNNVVSGFLQSPVFEKMKDYNPHVTFKAECDKNLPNIKGSPVHLEKTLMNLVSNAAESISGEGVVTIRTESRYLDKPVRGYDEIKEGDYAVLTVSDTGMGIPVKNKEKIFEPFYTKKTMGRSGTGLGLAIVWGTVKDHNGYIDVQTEVGEGTTFTLYFPVTREEMIAQQQKVPVERYMGKGESVLVVDDVAEQRDVASRLLTRLGYEVHAVSSGEEAVEYLKGNKADILVLDMIMVPGIDGLETYQRILEINQRQKAILVSGFSQTERVNEAQKLGAGAYVKKPYFMEKIGAAIRDELYRK
jgi:two-component system cell cycle sensor histidine kinase/response regulator CckA